jgi:plasmid replication initiation protein
MPRKKMPPAPLAKTASEELPIQTVLDFFASGVPITAAPQDIVLKKSNAAIRVVTTLGLFERKIIDACILIAKPRLTDNVVHSADLEYFKWLISYNSKNRDFLKKAITKIQQTLIQINIVDDQDPTRDFWHSTNFLYDVSITNGKIFFRVPESIQKPLQDPDNWTHLSFRIKNRFSSEYAYVLYERCRLDQYRGATEWWTIDEFRHIVNARDIYGEFQDLQKRVIKVAVAQINEQSDILITPDYKTRGRAKTHIRFIIEVNPNVMTQEKAKEHLPQRVFDQLKNQFGFSNSQVDEVAHYDLEYLEDKIEFALHRIKQSKKKIARPDLYLMKVLKEDLRFTETERSQIELGISGLQTPTLGLREDPDSPPAETEASIIRNHVKAGFSALSEPDQEHYLSLYAETLETPADSVSFKKHGLQSKRFAVLFFDWLASQGEFLSTLDALE